MELFEKTVSKEIKFQGRVFTAELCRVELPDGSETLREIASHPGGVAVLAVDGEERCVMVEQFRSGAGEVMTEIPAGKLEPGEEPSACGMRELKEETGFTCGKFLPLGEIWPTPGYCTEKIYLFLAEDLAEGETNPDEGEFVKTHLVPLNEVLEKIKNGEICDAKTIAAIFKYKLLKDSGFYS